MRPDEDATPDVNRRLVELAQLDSGLGHHIINAFSAIVSNAELIKVALQAPDHGGAGAKAPDMPDPHHVADTIIQAAMDGSDVMRRMIDYTRPTTLAGFAPLSLHRLVADFAAEGQRAEGPGIEWITDLTPVAAIRGNAGHLRLMLDHLTRNAREALGPGDGRIALTTRTDDRGWIILEVRDTGCGMPTQVLQRAIEPFFTTKPGRFGVGLTIAHGVWRRHRGLLGLQSAEGHGTTIRLSVEPDPSAE